MRKRSAVRRKMSNATKNKNALPARRGPGRPANPLTDQQKDDAIDSAAILQDMALDLFSRRGFHAVTIKDIAAATGLNAALIYYYFGSKEELFQQTVQIAIDRAFEQFEALAQGHTAPNEIIHDWIETHIKQRELIRKLVQISLDYSKMENRAPETDAAIRQFYDRERAVLSGAIRAGIRQKLFRKVDPDQMAEFISTFLDGAMVRSLIFDDFNSSEAIRGLQNFIISHLTNDRG